jgi:hypothetical protein
VRFKVKKGARHGKTSERNNGKESLELAFYTTLYGDGSHLSTYN